MASGLFASTVITGGLLVATAAALLRLREWRRDNPPSETSVFDAAEAVIRDERTWLASYVVLALVAVGGVYAFVSGAVTPAVAASARYALAVAFTGAIAVFLAAGTYHAVRARGRASAQAAGAGVTAVGVLVLVLVVAKLVFAGG